MKVWKHEGLSDMGMPGLTWEYISPSRNDPAKTIRYDGTIESQTRVDDFRCGDCGRDDEGYELIKWHGRVYKVQSIDLDHEK